MPPGLFSARRPERCEIWATACLVVSANPGPPYSRRLAAGISRWFRWGELLVPLPPLARRRTDCKPRLFRGRVVGLPGPCVASRVQELQLVTPAAPGTLVLSSVRGRGLGEVVFQCGCLKLEPWRAHAVGKVEKMSSAKGKPCVTCPLTPASLMMLTRAGRGLKPLVVLPRLAPPQSSPHSAHS